MDSDLVNVPDVDVDVGRTKQTDPEQSVEGPQGARRRTIASSRTRRRLGSPTTEIQTTDVTRVSKVDSNLLDVNEPDLLLHL